MPPLSSPSSSNHIGPASPPRFSALHIEDPLPPAVLADVQGRGMSVHVLISSYLLYEGEDAARGLLSGWLGVGLLTGDGRGRGRRVGGGAGATVRGGGRLRGQWHRRYRRDSPLCHPFRGPLQPTPSDWRLSGHQLRHQLLQLRQLAPLAVLVDGVQFQLPLHRLLLQRRPLHLLQADVLACGVGLALQSLAEVLQRLALLPEHGHLVHHLAEADLQLRQR